MKQYQLLAGKIDQQRANLIGRTLFNKYDLDRKGILDKNQCYSIFSDYCYRILNFESPPTIQDVQSMQTVFDANHDNIISSQDFETLAVKYLCPHLKYQNYMTASTKVGMVRKYTKIARDRLQVAKRLFLKFDKDESGFITQQEVPGIIMQTYKQMGKQYNPTREDIQSWMKMTDENKDGKVSFNEFENLIIRSLERCGIQIYE